VAVKGVLLCGHRAALDVVVKLASADDAALALGRDKLPTAADVHETRAA
jgi:hypothetical protein